MGDGLCNCDEDGDGAIESEEVTEGRWEMVADGVSEIGTVDNGPFEQ
jgi:hypothetical protein